MPRGPSPGGWCVGRRHQEQTYFAIFALPGRLAQLVQSTSFTPRGSGFESLTAHPEQSTKAPAMQGLFVAQTRTKLACGRERAAKSRLARRAGFCACSENAPPLGPPTEACEGGSPPAAHARTKLACWRKRAIISFGATPQCFQEHHEGRHPPQTNCRPPKPRLLSHHARGRHPVLPAESP